MNHPYASARKPVSLLKAEARASLLGRIRVPVTACILYDLASLFLIYLTRGSSSSGNRILSIAVVLLTDLVISIFVGMLEIGLVSISMSLHFNREPDFQPSISSLFCCYRENPDRAVKLRAVFALGSMVCSIPSLVLSTISSGFGSIEQVLLIGAGIIVGNAFYAVFCSFFLMANYLYLDFPELTTSQLLKTSCRLMKGNKRRYLLLCIEFIPLNFLGLLSLGIAQFFVDSYFYSCCTALYNNIIECQ